MAVLDIGAAIYAVGSFLLARPYVSRPVTLFIAVPVAAVAGMAVSGALAVVVAVCSVPSAISLLPTFTQVAAAPVRGQGDGDSDPACRLCWHLSDDGNRYADLTFGACRTSTRCGSEQTMTTIRTTGHDTTVKIQSLLSGAPAAPEIT